MSPASLSLAALSLLGLAIGAVLALLVGLNADRLGERLGLLDHPDPEGGRKIHPRITPLVGGLAVVTAALVGVALPGVSTGFSAGLFALVVAGMFLIGFADDRWELSAPFRFLFVAVLLLVMILGTDDFRILFLHFAGQTQLVLMAGFVGIAFTLICLLGFLNAVNMADGKNGLVIGQAIIWCAVLALRLPPPQVPLVAAIAGSLMVLLAFNLRGRLFLGDNGSYGLSAIFGLLAIHAWNTGFADFNADDIAVLFALPVFDTLRLIGQRLINRQSPFTPGRDHLHHYLHARWGWPGPLPAVLLLVAIPNAGALMFPDTGLAWLAVTLAGYVLLLWLATRPRAVSALRLPGE